MSIFGGFKAARASATAAEVTQFGTAYLPRPEGGPLAVNAKGRSDGGGIGFVGGSGRL